MRRAALVGLLVLSGSTAIGATSPIENPIEAGRHAAYDLAGLFPPDAKWVDQAGLAVTAATFAGSIVLLDIATSTCPSVCAVRALDMTAVHDALPLPLRARVRLVSVSLDAGDRPETLKAFAGGLRLDRSGWTLLSADKDGVRHLGLGLALFPPGQVALEPGAEPPSKIFLFDRRGQLMQRYGGRPVDRRRLVQEIETLDAFDDELTKSKSPK